MTPTYNRTNGSANQCNTVQASAVTLRAWRLKTMNVNLCSIRANATARDVMLQYTTNHAGVIQW